MATPSGGDPLPVTRRQPGEQSGVESLNEAAIGGETGSGVG
jgi:hypothetical protein